MISSKNKIYITVGVFIIIFLVLIALGAIPFLGKVKQSSQNLVAQNSLLNLVNARIVEVEGFQDNRSQLRQDLNRIESVFIEEDSPVIFLNSLESIAKRTELSIDIFPSAASSETTDLWSSVGFRLSIEGDVENCLKFLEILEHSKWMFDILYLSLDKTLKTNQYEEAIENTEKAYMSIAVKAYSGEPL